MAKFTFEGGGRDDGAPLPQTRPEDCELRAARARTLFGVVLGLVETVCSPFTAASRLRDQEAAVVELREACEQQSLHKQALLAGGKAQEATLCSRALSLRQHAS